MLGLSIVLLLTSVQDMLIATPYMVFSPRLKGVQHVQYNGSTLIHQLLLSFLGSVGLVAAGGILSLGVGPAHLAPVMFVLAAVLAFIMLRNYVRRVCFAALRMKTALAIDCAVAVVQVGGLLLLAWLRLLTADRAYWAIGAACGIGALAWLAGNRRAFAVRLDQTLADFVRNWSFGKWIFASGLLWDVGMSFYPWILAWFYGTQATGVWAACLGVVSMGNPALLGVQNYLGPQIVHCRAEGGNNALCRFVLQASTAFCGFVLIFSLFLLVCGDWLLVLFYGAKYAGNSLVLYAMAMNLVVSAATFSISRGLLAMERADVDFIINAVAVVLLLSAGLWLVQAWGVFGAALSILLTNVVILVAKYAAFTSLCGSIRSPAA
jgi:O-antigen/teichoic acid export membrane protein